MFENLENHVRYLSELGEKSHSNIQALNLARDYIIQNFGKDNILVQEYKINDQSFFNIELTLKGLYNSDNIILVGAHYDTLYSGANDNCSGIACLLELAKIFKKEQIDKTIKFVAFTNEEPPFFMTDKMGSRIYSKMCFDRNDIIDLALIFDLVGYYTEAPNSQDIPLDVSITNTTGNFLGLVSSQQSSLDKCSYNNFPSEKILVDKQSFYNICSDHYSFSKLNYPSVLLTDTAMLRYDYYHTEYDTYEKLNYIKMNDMLVSTYHMLKELTGVVK